MKDGENEGGLENPAFVLEENKEGKWGNNNVPGDDADPDVGAVEAMTPKMEYGPKENRRMLKNLVVICFAFMLLFTAFQSMASLQNSINSAVGVYSLATVYGALVVSSMFLPTFLIQKFTVKWTLGFAVLGYSVYIAAQFHPRYWTLIPAAVVVGTCGAPLWSAKCTYLTHLGHQYAALTKDDAQVIIVRFFGFFFLFFQSSSIWGNLISSAVLSQDARNCTNDAARICGVDFCPSTKFCDYDPDADSGPKEMTSSQYLLAAIYLGCSLAAAVVIVLLLDPLLRYGEKERQGAASREKKQSHLFFATFKHMKHPYQIMIIPLTIWSGMEQGFFGAEFTTGWVDCAWNIDKIGYVLICYGVVDAAASVSFGPIIRRVGRVPVFIFGAAVNVGIIIVLFTWTPNKEESIIFFVIAGCWGISDAIWQTQINAFYGVIFPQDEEAAFSNYRLWESVGFILAYVFTNVLCVRIKLWILLGIVATGMVGYLLIEIAERKKKNSIK